MIDTGDFWLLTILLGIGTFLIRFSFLGFLGGRELPEWLLLHLRYVGISVFPALVTPMLLWPAATGGETDWIRVAAGAIAFVAGMRISVIGAILSGMGAFYGLRAIESLL
ncbi:AzlD domain-containing protein [Mangrovicoccus algicola]|uniref:AzlD domain-containing protein n=1 Tax=Mangrovicoccus algicola TaxID=2771008 RepID=A0A8J6YZ31_9RHOB|nr:AzlD domain-containing protein [Mangrovicoccus algicola]MBE3638438.1 AzlD domain-containing protein [Mangrovicoccus algicola]